MTVERGGLGRDFRGPRRNHEQGSSAIVSAFVDGARLTYDGIDAGWRISTDETLTAFWQENIGQDPHRLTNNTGKIAREHPALNQMFRHSYRRLGPHDGNAALVTIPTIATANAFSEEKFTAVGSAGIKLIQTTKTTEEGDTPLAEYLDNLLDGKMSVSINPERALHDFHAHWLGGVTTEKNEFEIFKALGDEINPVRQKFGEGVAWQYMLALGLGFDMYSAFKSFGLRDEGRQNVPYTYLPDDVMLTMGIHCPLLLDQSHEIINSFGTDGVNKEYYHDVIWRLKGTPWLPANYTPPELAQNQTR